MIGQQIDVSPEGRIVVTHPAGHLIQFQVFVRGTAAICMTAVDWAVGGSSDPFDIIDAAKLMAERAATDRGWLSAPVHWAAL